MTVSTIVSMIGWASFVVAYLVKWYLTKKEEKVQSELNSRITKIDELFLEGKVQLSFDIEDHKIKKFGPLGSYGISLQILTFGMGVFVTNIIYLFFN